MIRPTAILTGLALLLLAAVPGRAAIFAPETFTLDNGMRVVVIETPSMPAVHHMVWYRVGGADEPPGRSGMAHLFEHLMFKGTQAHPGDAVSRIVARNGGRQNAFTGYDYTAYFQSVARDRLGLMMALEADRMVNLRLNPEDVKTERDVVLEERRMRVENNPSALLRERMRAGLWRTHPYRRPLVGWPHELGAVTRGELETYYERWYAPNNAILVVAGNVTADAVRRLAETHYGPIPAREIPERSRSPEVEHVVSQRVTLRHPQVGQPTWRRLFQAPSYTDGTDHSRVHALEVLAEMLGGGSASRLNRSLVLEQELAVAAGARYSGERLGPGRFAVHASPRDETSMETLEKAVEAEIDRLLDEGVTAQEVDAAARRLVAGVVYARDSLSGGAHILGRTLALGLDLSTVESWPERIRGVTPQQVEAAARAVLRRDRSVTGLLLRTEAASGPAEETPE